MNNVYRIVAVLIAVILVSLILTTAAYAQTDEPTAVPTVEVTPEPTPVPPVEEPPSADTYISLSTLLYGLIIAVLGGGTVGVIINRFGGSKANLDAAEKLFLSFPPETRELIEHLINIIEAGVDVGRKVTDGQPNDEPPTAFSVRSYPPHE